MFLLGPPGVGKAMMDGQSARTSFTGPNRPLGVT